MYFLLEFFYTYTIDVCIDDVLQSRDSITLSSTFKTLPSIAYIIQNL